MANTLLIEKNGYNKFWHTHNENPLTKYAISDFECSIDGNTFKITEFDGAVRFNYLIENITVKDNTTGGAEETFTDPLAFYNRLISLDYTPFLNNNQTTTPNVILKKGMAVVWHKTQEYIDANFDETGLGIKEAVGWAKRNGQNGTRDARDRVSVAQGTVHNDLTEIGGSEDAVVVAHSHSMSYGYIGADASAQVNRDPDGNTVIGTTNTDSTGVSGVGKNMQPYLVEFWVERTEDLVIFAGGQSGTSIPSLTKFIVTPTISIEDFALDVSAGEWIINNVDFTNSGASFVVNIPSTGYTRLDLIIADNAGEYRRIQGIPSLTNPASPALPLNTLLVSVLTVSESSVGVVPATLADLISSDSGNVITIGADGKLYVNSVGGIPNLQQVTDEGNSTTNPLQVIMGDGTTSSVVYPDKILSQFYNTDGGALEFLGTLYTSFIRRFWNGSSMVDNEFLLPEKAHNSTHTIALTSDIPDVSGKEDSSNKVTTFTGNETSTTKFPVVKAILDYFTTSRIKTLLGQASSTVDGWISSTDWNTFNNKQNALGYTPENYANKGAANGYVPLNSSTKIDTTYFPDSIIGQLLYGGVIDASTAIATLTNNAKSKLGTSSSTITLTNNTTAITGYVANEGIYYIATVAGTFASVSFDVGDWLVSIGSAWKKIDNTDAIASFNGRTGVITLTSSDVTSALGFTPVTNARTVNGKQLNADITLSSSDIGEGTNLYWTTARGLALVLSGLSASSGTFTSTDTLLTAFGNIKYLIDNIATTYQAILTDVNFGTFSNGLTAKNTLVDADTVNTSDSADSNKSKKTSWLNVWVNFLKPKADLLYFPISTSIVKILIDDTVTSSDVTGTSESLVKSYTIVGDASIKFLKLFIDAEKTGGNAIFTVRVYMNSSNSYAGSTLIATATTTAGSNTTLNMNRLHMSFKSGALKTVLATTSFLTDTSFQSNVVKSSYTINNSNNMYLFVTLQNNSGTDTSRILAVNLKN